MKIEMFVLMLLAIWAGLLIGISFIEAPLKFQAPGITTELGLGIGKLVFSFSNKVQLVFTLMLIAGLFSMFDMLSTIVRVFAFLLIGIMMIQTFYLFPILDNRVTEYIAGTAKPSYHHITFIILEVIKTFTLLFLFVKIYPK